MNLEKIIDQLTEIVVSYGPRLLGAIAVYIIGSFIIKGLNKFFAMAMDKRDVDASLKPFLRSLVSTTLRVLLIISVLSTMGIEMTSFVAILGAAGLAIGMALSGTLQNFAGGVVILMLRPYRVGDFIEAQGYSGTVNEIQIFHTVLKTPDNKTVVIPNGPMSTGSLINYSTEDLRRVDFTFGIGYGDSTEKTREVLRQIIKSDERILNEPAEPFIEVGSLGDNSVNFTVRIWVKKEDYWGVYFRMQDEVYNQFNEAGLNIPFPQMDVHLHND